MKAARALVYEGIVSGIVIGIVGLLGLLARQPWLFPSLGPTIFLQTANPKLPAAHPWNAVAGHAAGALAGFACVLLTGADQTPPVMSSGDLSPERIVATALAVALTMAAQSLLRAQHPPAAATTMLLTLGGLKPTANTAATLAAGVLCVTLLGEGARRLHPDHQVKKSP